MKLHLRNEGFETVISGRLPRENMTYAELQAFAEKLLRAHIIECGLDKKLSNGAGHAGTDTTTG